jgi:hypothetical protein
MSQLQMMGAFFLSWILQMFLLECHLCIGGHGLCVGLLGLVCGGGPTLSLYICTPTLGIN